jgi:hypothetical protein
VRPCEKQRGVSGWGERDGAPRDVMANNETALNTMLAYCENEADCRRGLVSARP